MTRKKVKLVRIVNDSARKASLKKRKIGLLKKVRELTTLCGVNGFVIIFSPNEKEPVTVWPSRPVIQQLLARFHSLPEMERCKKMTNQESYLKERVTKVQEQMKKHQRRNKEMDVSRLMHQLYQGKRQDEFNINELHGLFWFAEEKKKEIRKRIDCFQQINALPVTSLPPAGPETEDETAQTRGDASGEGRTPTEPVQWEQWFIDMMNNSDNNTAAGSSRVINSDLGPTPQYQTLADGSSAANQMGLPYGGSEIGLQPNNSTNIGRQDGGNDTGLGLHPHGNIGAGGSEMGLPSEYFGGNSAGSDAVPFDVTKKWPNNFYP